MQRGLGGNAAGVVEGGFRRLIRRDARRIARAINDAVTAKVLERIFPGKPVLAQFAWDTEVKRTSREVLEDAGYAMTAGLAIDIDQVQELTGYKLTKAPETPDSGLPSYPSRPSYPSQNGLNAAVPAKTALQTALAAFKNARSVSDGQGDPSGHPPSQIAKKRPSDATGVLAAFAKDTTPAAKAVQELLKDFSEESCEKFLAELPKLMPDDPVTATVLADAMAEAMASQLSPSSQTSQGEVANMRDVNGMEHDKLGRFGEDGGGAAAKDSPQKPAADKAGSRGDSGSSGEPAEAANDGKIDFKGNARAKAKADNQAQSLGYAGIDDLMMQSKSVPSERVAEIVAGGEQPCKPHEAVAALRSHATIQPNVKGEEPVKLTERPIRHYVCGERRHRGGEPEVSRLESLPLAIKAIRESDSFYHEMGGERVVRMPGEQLPKGTQTVYERKSGTGKSKAFAYTDSGVLNGWQLN